MRQEAENMALNMYANEPCRICGEMIINDDLPDLVFAGYSKDNKSRAAHGGCWQEKGRYKKKWKHPVDA